MSDEIRYYAEGTHVKIRYPWGLYLGGRALCEDGRVRRLKRIAPSAEDFETVPAAVKVKGRTVSGYVTARDASKPLRFVATGRNAGLIPNHHVAPTDWLVTLTCKRLGDTWGQVTHRVRAWTVDGAAAMVRDNHACTGAYEHTVSVRPAVFGPHDIGGRQ
jgi:hypothetical protein